MCSFVCFFSSSFNFLWTHCLYLFRYRKFYRALCSVASVCADGFSLAHKCECMLVCACAFVWVCCIWSRRLFHFQLRISLYLGIYTDLIIMWALNIFLLLHSHVRCWAHKRDLRLFISQLSSLSSVPFSCSTPSIALSLSPSMWVCQILKNDEHRPFFIVVLELFVCYTTTGY